jgi:hypothetical protein
VRVVDESSEDYLYPADHFVAVELPREAERALRPAWTSVFLAIVSAPAPHAQAVRRAVQFDGPQSSIGAWRG